MRAVPDNMRAVPDKRGIVTHVGHGVPNLRKPPM